MPTLSVFAFERQYQQLAGPFYQMHRAIDQPLSGTEWEAIWSLSPPVQAIVAYCRPDNEVCQSLSAVINDPAVLSFIDGNFASVQMDPHFRQPVRMGPIRASYKTWGDILAMPQTNVDPNLHQAWELINTFSIYFHVNSDWWLTALHGTIIIYAFYFLDADGHPQVRIDGFSDPVWDDDFRADFGAAAKLSAGLTQELVNDTQVLQSFLEGSLRSFAGDGVYSDLYTLPGTGDKVSAPIHDDADINVALCLIPQG